MVPRVRRGGPHAPLHGAEAVERVQDTQCLIGLSEISKKTGTFRSNSNVFEILLCNSFFDSLISAVDRFLAEIARGIFKI